MKIMAEVGMTSKNIANLLVTGVTIGPVEADVIVATASSLCFLQLSYEETV